MTVSTDLAGFIQKKKKITHKPQNQGKPPTLWEWEKGTSSMAAYYLKCWAFTEKYDTRKESRSGWEKMLTDKVPEEAQAMRLSDKNTIQVIYNALKNLLKQLKETV